MNLTRRPASVFSSLVAVLLLSVAALAQATHKEAFPQVEIKNFGQMDERFYRGGQPKEDQYESLKALGIQTVVDLQAKPKPYERQIVESLGMRYVNIPMVEKKYPTEEAVAAFRQLVEDPSTGKFYVHCAGGRHRTGAMGAVYRFDKYGWNFDQVYREMKDFDFYTSWGHGDFKDFVEDYWNKLQTARTQQPAAAPAAAATAGAKK